ncbi:membrane protein YqaA with SNARE-associated domain [Pasteurella langaaensis DSM 22999]|uniref:Membrane protein YqaA with SNARE-associated domain n=1 Tax=Alitibacter langaaensis DSM 22999 TaxID=1122935 RepID=A0A2U0TGP0_9PAST|nr:YqaA family protein [Pasteurella langaaensis]PVX42694.1 membrane protein YqaA with SNARE-associated domain [Pasteurella langaaensis DSM 22999]
MFDFLTALWHEYPLWLMFISAFLSATILPGNSEAIFLGLATTIQLAAKTYFSEPIAWLISSATLGNTLGSITTYCLGRWLPSPKFNTALNKNDNKVRWVLTKFQRYGTWALLFSWLPIVGDLFCAVAGWLRLNSLQTLLFIFIGKFLRYLFLLYLVVGYTFL